MKVGRYFPESFLANPSSYYEFSDTKIATDSKGRVIGSRGNDSDTPVHTIIDNSYCEPVYVSNVEVGIKGKYNTITELKKCTSYKAMTIKVPKEYVLFIDVVNISSDTKSEFHIYDENKLIWKEVVSYFHQSGTYNFNKNILKVDGGNTLTLLAINNSTKHTGELIANMNVTFVDSSNKQCLIKKLKGISIWSIDKDFIVS